MSTPSHAARDPFSIAASPDFTEAGGEVQYSRDIEPILADRCFSCHGPDEANREADLRLDSFEFSTEDLGGYSAIVPGDIEASELWYRLITDDPDEFMPPADSDNMPLSASELELVQSWIRAGASYHEHVELPQPAEESRVEPLHVANTDLPAVNWPDAIGRFHPVLVHLPIGLIVALAILEFPRLFRRSTPEHDSSRSVLVALLAITAPLSALTGWLLHEGAGYGHPVDWHKWLGIGLAVLTVLVAVAYWRKSENYTLGVMAAFVLLLPTAHFGATLTHGSGFLTAPWTAGNRGEESASIQVADEQRAGATSPPIPYTEIAPILKQYCTKCHGSRKRKGKLALHTLEGILAGGENGNVLTPGDPQNSKLISSLRAPLDAEEHMPPKEKRQPSSTAMELLERWILGLEPSPSNAVFEPAK